MSLAEEFVAYLKQGDFLPFMEAWRQQMIRLGHVGGTISIALQEQNRKDMEGLLGKDYHNQKHANISWHMLQKAIANSRFETVDFEEVLTMYFHGEIISKKVSKAMQEQKEEAFLSLMEQNFQNKKAGEWLRYVKEQNDIIMTRIRQALKEQPDDLGKQLTWAMEGLNALPLWKQKNQNLAIFASQITGNPHAFDAGMLANYFLFHGICYFLNIPYEKMNGIEKNSVFFQAGLYRDSVSNFCMLAHIDAFQANQKHHPGWHGFSLEYEAWNVNIGNVQAIETIDATSCEIVYVVENPSVFQYLVQILASKQANKVGVLCTNGQLNFCGYLMMDKLYQAGILMLYSGDMDPEGLLIADKVKQRYGDNLTLWHYEMEDYHVSQSTEYADHRRLAMIDKIQHKQLHMIAEQLKQSPIGYQENLLEIYRQDILDYFSTQANET